MIFNVTWLHSLPDEILKPEVTKHQIMLRLVVGGGFNQSKKIVGKLRKTSKIKNIRNHDLDLGYTFGNMYELQQIYTYLAVKHRPLCPVYGWTPWSLHGQ